MHKGVKPNEGIESGRKIIKNAEIKINLSGTPGSVTQPKQDPKFAKHIDRIIELADLTVGVGKKLAVAYTVFFYFATEAKREKLGAVGFAGFLPLIIAEAVGLLKDAMALMWDASLGIYKLCGQGSDGCCIEPEAFFKNIFHTKKSGEKIAWRAFKRLAFSVIPTGAIEYAMLRSWLLNSPTAYVNAPLFAAALGLSQGSQAIDLPVDIIALIKEIAGCTDLDDCCKKITVCCCKRASNKEEEQQIKSCCERAHGIAKIIYSLISDRGLPIASVLSLMTPLIFFAINLARGEGKEIFSEKVLEKIFYTSVVAYCVDATTDALGIFKTSYIDEGITKALKKAREKNATNVIHKPIEDDGKKSPCCKWLEDRYKLKKNGYLSINDDNTDEKGKSLCEKLRGCCKKNKKKKDDIVIEINSKKQDDETQLKDLEEIKKDPLKTKKKGTLCGFFRDCCKEKSKKANISNSKEFNKIEEGEKRKLLDEGKVSEFVGSLETIKQDGIGIGDKKGKCAKFCECLCCFSWFKRDKSFEEVQEEFNKINENLENEILKVEQPLNEDQGTIEDVRKELEII
jgi:hypothetical protein